MTDKTNEMPQTDIQNEQIVQTNEAEVREKIGMMSLHDFPKAKKSASIICAVIVVVAFVACAYFQVTTWYFSIAFSIIFNIFAWKEYQDMKPVSSINYYSDDLAEIKQKLIDYQAGIKISRPYVIGILIMVALWGAEDAAVCSGHDDSLVGWTSFLPFVGGMIGGAWGGHAQKQIFTQNIQKMIDEIDKVL